MNITNKMAHSKPTTAPPMTPAKEFTYDYKNCLKNMVSFNVFRIIFSKFNRNVYKTKYVTHL